MFHLIFLYVLYGLFVRFLCVGEVFFTIATHRTQEAYGQNLSIVCIATKPRRALRVLSSVFSPPFLALRRILWERKTSHTVTTATTTKGRERD